MENYDKYLYSKSTHYISNSGGDENGNIHGGKAGDQTGTEWRLRSWYSRPWTHVFRYHDKTVALEIAKMGCAGALNDKIGYDQYQRTTYWTQLAKSEYDPSKITVACEEDCSAGVSANVKGVGYRLGIAKLKSFSASCTSRNIKGKLIAAGFECLTDSKYLKSGKYLLPGDILLYENHHVATNVTIGANAQWDADSEQNSGGTEDHGSADRSTQDGSKMVVATGGRVNIRSGPGTEFNSVGVISDGDKVAQVDCDGWMLIAWNGGCRWISKKYVKDGVVIGGVVNVRTGPSTDYKSVGVARKGTKVKEVETGIWICVQYNGSANWISGKMAQVES